MKKQYFYVLIIIILILVVFLGRKNQQQYSSRSDKINFATSDTNLITKITLENKNLEKIKLHRNNGDWILNDSLKANRELVNLALKTIKEMRIKRPISKAALPHVIKRMAIQNTELNIFQKNKKIKTIYIGGETPDQLGTFMMIHGAKEPYIIHIPGFNGYLSSRFSCKENVWTSKKIFSNIPISAQYTFENQTHTIQTLNLKELNDMHCESFLTNNQHFNINEIKSRTSFFTLETIKNNGEKQILHCIRKKPVNKEKYRSHQYDRERFYGLLDNNLMLIQYKQFELFIKKESIENKFMPWKNLNSF